MNNAVIEIERQATVAETPVKESIPNGPAMLPAHVLAVGKHHQLADSIWWIGCARPAYEEVSHLRGVVLYNRTTHIFLTREEAADVQRLLLLLMGKDI